MLEAPFRSKLFWGKKVFWRRTRKTHHAQEDPLQFVKEATHHTLPTKKATTRTERIKLDSVWRNYSRFETGRTQDQTELHKIYKNTKSGIFPPYNKPILIQKGAWCTCGCSWWLLYYGSSPTEYVAANEHPCYGVHIPVCFRCWNTRNTRTIPRRHGHTTSYFGHPKHPVHNISWHDALILQCILPWMYNPYTMEPIGIATQMIDYSRAEWEYSCFSEPNLPIPTQPHRPDVPGIPKPILSHKSTNVRGLFDMSGQVEEWCWDYFGPYPETGEHNLFLHYSMGPPRGDERVLREVAFLCLRTSTM